MFIYIVVLISIIALGLFAYKKGDNKLAFVIIAFFILAIVSAIRGRTVGVDTYQYYNF